MADAASLFARLDGNKDGLLCPEDLTKAVRGLPMMTAWQLIAELDATGEGYVPFEAFDKHMKEVLAHGEGEDDDMDMTWRKIFNGDTDMNRASLRTEYEAPSALKAPMEKENAREIASMNVIEDEDDEMDLFAVKEVASKSRVQDEWKSTEVKKQSMEKERKEERVSNVDTEKKDVQPAFATMRQALKPVPLSELPRSMSQDDANALATATPRADTNPESTSGVSAPPPPIRQSSSKLQMFLKEVPPNHIQRQSSFGLSASEQKNVHSTPIDDEVEAKRHKSEPTSSGSIDESANLLAQPFGEPTSAAIDPELDLFGPPSPIPSTRRALTIDTTYEPETEQFPVVNVERDSEPELGNGLEQIKFDLANCLESIRKTCSQFTHDDEQKASEVLAALQEIKSKISMRNLPPFLEQELKSFDRSSLTAVDDAEKTYNTVSIQHVQQAMKIRAFRKTVLPQVFPTVPDDPLSVLSDLFPDIFIDTIQQMYDACAQDLQSCFQVLSGLSDYSSLDGALSPKQAYLRKSLEKKKSQLFEDDDDDDVNAPLFPIKGYTKPERKVESRVENTSGMSTHGFLYCPISEETTQEPTTSIPSDELQKLFGDFVSGQNMPDILEAWASLSLPSTLEHNQTFTYVKNFLRSSLSFRQARIFEILDKKRQDHQLYVQQGGKGRRVCIVGAGPVGLRTAIELALVGAEVVVIEKRTNFNRENILHLFPWVVHDLTLLGAKFFYPQFCMSSSYLHIGTRQLQCILLKSALLLGVKVCPDMAFDGIQWTDVGYAVQTTPPLPSGQTIFTALIGAGGSRDTIGGMVGINRKAFSPSPAVGAVAIFPNLHTKQEVSVKQFSWASQYNQTLFGRLKQELGVDTENIVYYREEVHYVVMTPKKQSLLDAGVLESKDLSSVNLAKLSVYMEQVLEFFGIPFLRDKLDVQLFDFSQTLRAERPSVVLPHDKNKLFVALVGDALLEPFWPQGLGINRGFLSALDTCYAITRLDKADEATVLSEHEQHYKRCAGLTLQPNIGKFNVDPKSRYKA